MKEKKQRGLWWESRKEKSTGGVWEWEGGGGGGGGGGFKRFKCHSRNKISNIPSYYS